MRVRSRLTTTFIPLSVECHRPHHGPITKLGSRIVRASKARIYISLPSRPPRSHLPPSPSPYFFYLPNFLTSFTPNPQNACRFRTCPPQQPAWPGPPLCIPRRFPPPRPRSINITKIQIQIQILPKKYVTPTSLRETITSKPGTIYF
jgi:hypothetical protein